MKASKRSILVAMALGDGYLLKDPNSNSVSLQIEHCAAQEKYLEWKRDLLVSLVGGFKPIITTRTRTRANSQLISYRFTKAVDYFRILFKWFKEDKTKYSERILNKLDAAGLAIWIMDDGTVTKRYRQDGTTHAVQFKLSLCTPSTEEVQTVIDVLNKNFGVKMYRTIHMRRKIDNAPLYSISCGTVEYKKLAEIISPHMCECMRYKIV